MKRTICVVLLALLSTAVLFAAYPDEYPLYLRMLGFSKSEIRSLRDGGFVMHPVTQKLPGEYGAVAAIVTDVPAYFFRDYYRRIESYKSIAKFQQIGQFDTPPTIQDLKPLRFDGSELEEFVSCKVKDCGLKMSEAEIAKIPEKPDLRTDEGKEAVADAYREMLLNRLLAYQKQGMKGLGKYDDGPTEYAPDAIFKTHLMKFPHLGAYFPVAEKYLLDYPRYRNNATPEFFYWAKDNLGEKPVITIQHVFSQKVGEDYLVIHRLVYGNHYLLSSISVTHLINYADNGVGRTLVAFEQRTLTDLRGSVLDAIGRNILRTNLEKKIVDNFKLVSKTLEERYRDRRTFPNYPYGLNHRDQQ